MNQLEVDFPEKQTSETPKDMQSNLSCRLKKEKYMKCRVPVYGTVHVHCRLNISFDLQTMGVQLLAEVVHETLVFRTGQ